MYCNEVLIAVSILGVSPEIDFETKQATGNIKLDVGFRNANGKHITRTIKIANTSVSEFSTYLDEKVTLRLEEVTFSPYLYNGRAALSIKAESATIEG
ncbi:hypothetical protein ACVRZG_00635 [Streptococcus hyovaginalis]|uniref:hypothetical protein n=1 Tax=Streptococcus hyovaginalis TaxID=149015 RepID=UPI0004A2BA4E|nr:hypothetical protein [Streptococcus hyovaginalis]